MGELLLKDFLLKDGLYLKSSMPGINAHHAVSVPSSKHYDFESLQPYFYEETDDPAREDDFYSTPSPSVPPSEDIWKKFELLPTPPRSPSHPAPKSFIPTVAEKLEMVSELLDEDVVNQSFIFPLDTQSLKSKLIQDCMWSGYTNEEKVEKAAQAQEATPPPMDYTSNDCVDPMAVFPYPLSETTPKENPQRLGTQTPSDSEEEIDVVTVEKMHPKRRISSAVVHHNYCATLPVKRSRSSTPSSSPQHSPSLVKRLKSVNVSELKAAIQPYVRKSTSNPGSRANSRPCSRPSSAPTSDSEDSESKRSTHNILERKRRNDLKASFVTLRDSVPELKDNERAPKVNILRKATDYIQSLDKEMKKLNREKDAEQKRQQHLLQRLQALQKLCRQ
ncbi:PREDICTED: transcriptional regulator Myc-like [Branchiostoma belcheri]|uniref:Transcriptional regulator Myc-like n=1 Tax=Branchiostoma belcheri TaxID=7741 RepID=A0A6P4YED5_BRABE|nr:PREDICTED: transcriptional regulator Myc-like [Branchiostoma belcheri]KAI8496017.1 hypothetical protein Bbelb_264330 [Branchiostoma belcheri]